MVLELTPKSQLKWYTFITK